MLNFPTKTLDLIKKKLLNQQKEVEKDLVEVMEDDPAKSPDLAESSEPGTDSYIADAHNRIVVLGANLKKLRDNIKSSLIKIQKGTYGKCEKCGKQIEIGRLLIMPTAEYCLLDSKKLSK